MINIQRGKDCLLLFQLLTFSIDSFRVQRDWRVSMSINIENNLINRRRKQETFLSKNYQNSYTQQRNKASSIQIFPPLDQRQEIKLFKKREKKENFIETMVRATNCDRVRSSLQFPFPSFEQKRLQRFQFGRREEAIVKDGY